MAETKIILTKSFRASYAYVFEPHFDKKQNKSNGFGVAMLFPKSEGQYILDTFHIPLIRMFSEKFGQLAAEAMFVRNGALIWPPAQPYADKWPIKDGDSLMDKNAHGHWVVKAKSMKLRPQVVGRSREPLAPGDFYSGCFGFASVSLGVFENNYGRFGTIRLHGVQFDRHGEPLSASQIPVEDMFQPLPEIPGSVSMAPGMSPIGGVNPTTALFGATAPAPALVQAPAPISFAPPTAAKLW
jgi:hypothetical protein